MSLKAVLILGAIVSHAITTLGAVGEMPTLKLFSGEQGDDAQPVSDVRGAMHATSLGQPPAGVAPALPQSMVSLETLMQMMRETVRSEMRTPDATSGVRISGDEKLTVRHYYELRMQIGREQTVASGTSGLDRLAIGRWEKYGRASQKTWRVDHLGRTVFDLTQERRIENPPLEWITDSDLKEFVTAMLADGLSAHSINQTLRHLSVLFEHAGPRSSTNRSGKGVIAIVPHVDPVPEELNENFIPTDDQFMAFARESLNCTWPRRRQLTPAQWWLGFLTFETNHGLRLGDAGVLGWDQWEDGLSAFSFVAAKTKRKRPYPMRFPTSVWTQTALRPLSQCGEERCFFGIASRREFEAQWDRILTATGMTETSTDAKGREYWSFDRHALRRYCNWRYNELHAQFPGEFICGHGFSGSDASNNRRRNQVNAKSYSKVYEAPAYVAEAIRSHPLPAGLSELIERHCRS